MSVLFVGFYKLCPMNSTMETASCQPVPTRFSGIGSFGHLCPAGDTEQKFVNVPTCLDGGTYFGHPASVSPGFWNIEFEPPTTLYVWLLDGSTNSLELVMPTQGWTVVNAPGFQTNDGYKLHLLSKYIEEEDRYTGRYECFRTISSYFCGGLVGTYPLPKEPEVMVSAAVPSVSEGADFPVTACSGLEIDWNPPTTMSEGTLTNPGEEDGGPGSYEAALLTLESKKTPKKTHQCKRKTRKTKAYPDRSWLFRMCPKCCWVVPTLAPSVGLPRAPGPSNTKLLASCTSGPGETSTTPGWMSFLAVMLGLARRQMVFNAAMARHCISGAGISRQDRDPFDLTRL